MVVEPERNRLHMLSIQHEVRRPGSRRPDNGRRLWAVDLSDLAAMGAEASTGLLSLVLPPTLPCADFDAMISAPRGAGIAGLASAWLAGTAASPRPAHVPT